MWCHAWCLFGRSVFFHISSIMIDLTWKEAQKKSKSKRTKEIRCHLSHRLIRGHTATEEHQSDQSGQHEQIQVNIVSGVLKTVWKINKKTRQVYLWNYFYLFWPENEFISTVLFCLFIYAESTLSCGIFLFRFVAETRQLRAGINLSLRCRERICFLWSDSQA